MVMNYEIERLLGSVSLAAYGFHHYLEYRLRRCRRTDPTSRSPDSLMTPLLKTTMATLAVIKGCNTCSVMHESRLVRR
jgi:hypothetical protein